MSVYTVSRSAGSSALLSAEAEIITLPERLDSATAPQFEKIVIDHITSGSYDLVLDCRNIRFMTAAGLRMILASLRAIKSVEGHLAVSHLHGQAKAMFEACGFDSLISTYGDQGAIAPAAIVAA